MLIIGLGIGLMVAGIVAIAKGKMQFSKTRAVEGVPARLLGIALLAPLPVSFLIAIVYTMTQIDPNKPDQAQAWAQQNEMTITLIQAGSMIGMAVVIIVIAALLARPVKPAKKKRFRDDYDDEERSDDRPRRRDEFAGDDDDRPRRKRDDLDDRAR